MVREGSNNPGGGSPPKRCFVEPVGPRLRILLVIVLGLFALLGINSVYLASVTFAEWVTDQVFQNFFYIIMFGAHLVMGLLIILPVIVFGFVHMFRAKSLPNKRAARVGYLLLAASLILLVTGIVLTRIEGILDVRNPIVRQTSYWLHIAMPVAIVWLFILHRLAGPRIKWKVGLVWGAVAGVFAVSMVFMHSQDPRAWNVKGPKSGEKYFFPSLSRTATGNFIPARTLMNDQYCLRCHEDIHKTWMHSVHKFSSFNNPPYLASIRATREALFKRDGDVQAARFCAGCHDPVPFFSGAFDDPKFDDPDYDLSKDEMAQAGITCTVCHAITNVNSPRGNADYTIEEPQHYPFVYSDSPFLQWVNETLVKAKPAMHKKTFLKPLHKTAEFCSTCHKVHLPKELNAYKFLRGQNHYDSFLLSGVSGHGVSSFYYPKKAEVNCNGCHMPLMASKDFGAGFFDKSGVLKVHNHMFPSANTGIAHLLKMPKSVIEAHKAFNKDVMRVDIFGVREEGGIDGKLHAPVRPNIPVLQPGKSYLFEAVIRTLKMGHLFTQGTADSNQVWMEVKVTLDNRVIGRSGGMDKMGRVDPWSHFVNAFVLDRNGNRIARRNAEDIFVSLYNNQIPPGAADVVHYQLKLPADAKGELVVEVQLKYRKFDTEYMQFVLGKSFTNNDLPIMTLATDKVTFKVDATGGSTQADNLDFPKWQRWNDYGIGLLRKGGKSSSRGQLRQAGEAFAEVEKLKRYDGPLNLARVALKAGRVNEAARALQRASKTDPPAPAWSMAWFSAIVDQQNGRFDEAIQKFEALVNMDTQETRDRGFDFSRDYRLLNRLGQTVYERARLVRGNERKDEREKMLRSAVSWFEKTLQIDPENVSAHYNLAQLHAVLGESQKATKHSKLHALYKSDEQAGDHAIAAARIKYPAANHAAEAVVIWDLQRTGAYDLKKK